MSSFGRSVCNAEPTTSRCSSMKNRRAFAFVAAPKVDTVPGFRKRVANNGREENGNKGISLQKHMRMNRNTEVPLKETPKKHACEEPHVKNYSGIIAISCL